MNIKRQEYAIAMPTKPFFVSMLTRDISLDDAILDLVDNCIDGALRSSIEEEEVDYSKFSVKITLTGDHFSIEDNCGGIPRKIAKEYAFKMGREPDDDRDSDNETIGMYGVGMKRAIFKMGREAEVRTLHGDDAFEVAITSEWLSQKGWDPLPIYDSPENKRPIEPGTFIRVEELYQGVKRHFENKSFVNELRTSLAEHFTMFIQRGLSISVNDVRVEPILVEVLITKNQGGPAPYVFQEIINGVTVSITVGLNTGRTISDEEIDSSEFERDRSSATSGWTVFCNDRAVIVGDKSRLTGWGDGIPLYHYQFSIITGIIEFRSKHAEQLPVTTTKRALDTSSEIWLKALVKMKEGMRIWITYTNAWKNHPRSDQTEYWVNAQSLPLRKIVETVKKIEKVIKPDGRIEFNPKKRKVIPFPPTRKPSSRRIVFSKPSEDIRTVSQALFDSPDEKPGIVGEKCFELVFEEAKKEGFEHE